MIAKLLISNSTTSRIKEIQKLLTDAKLTTMHPDLLYFSSDSKLGIAEARKIKEHFSLKPYSGKGRAVVLEDASNLTMEAQNALLKTIEELPEHALFVLSADSDSKLLSTIVSRAELVRLSTDLAGPTHPTYEVYTKDIEKLMDSTIEQRFEYIEKLKDREEFLHEMVSFFHRKLLEPATHERSHLLRLKQFLEKLVETEEWVSHNVNIRAILEYLMLVMPRGV